MPTCIEHKQIYNDRTQTMNIKNILKGTLMCFFLSASAKERNNRMIKSSSHRPGQQQRVLQAVQKFYAGLHKTD